MSACHFSFGVPDMCNKQVLGGQMLSNFSFCAGMYTYLKWLLVTDNLICYWLTEEYDSDEEESGDEEKKEVSAKMAIKRTRVR